MRPEATRSGGETVNIADAIPKQSVPSSGEKT